jgi:hypothetical protein
MNRVVSKAVLTGVGVGGEVVRKVVESSRRLRGGAADADSADRWRVVTIDRPPDEVGSAGRWPEPIARLGDTVEVQVRPAPGGKGAELAVRPRPGRSSSGPSGETPAEAVRSALRQAKQLIEVGEVLKVDPVPHGKRSHTPTGMVLEAATKRAGKEGIL